MSKPPKETQNPETNFPESGQEPQSALEEALSLREEDAGNRRS